MQDMTNQNQPAAPSQAQGMNEPGVENASQQEQEQLDKFLAFANMSLHSEQTQPMIIKALQGAESIPVGVGRVIALLAKQFENQTQTPLSDAVQGEVLPDLLEEVFEMVEAAGLMDASEINQEAIEIATKTVVKNYTKANIDNGSINEQNINQKLEALKSTPDGQKAWQQMKDQEQGQQPAPEQPTPEQGVVHE